MVEVQNGWSYSAFMKRIHWLWMHRIRNSGQSRAFFQDVRASCRTHCRDCKNEDHTNNCHLQGNQFLFETLPKLISLKIPHFWIVNISKCCLVFVEQLASFLCDVLFFILQHSRIYFLVPQNLVLLYPLLPCLCFYWFWGVLLFCSSLFYSY